MSVLPPSMSDRDGKIWMDGQRVDWRDAKIHVLSHTLHYGCGAFEGVRAYNTVGGTAIFRLEEHTERLFNSAKILRMKIPFTQEQVNEAQRAVVRENKLESCYLRPLTWIGDRKLGVSPKGNTIHPFQIKPRTTSMACSTRSTAWMVMPSMAFLGAFALGTTATLKPSLAASLRRSWPRGAGRT
ncbi:MAG: aminotransferase class IV, partial [Rhodoferax sp.]